MFNLYRLLAIGFIVGCASETQIIERDGSPMAGAGNDNDAGQTSGTGGNGNSAGSSGSGGNLNTGGTGNNAGTNMGGEAGDIGSGGGPCIPKTCDTYSFEQTGEIGRACGTIQDDGCGNVIDCTSNDNCGDTWERCGSGNTIIHNNGEISYPSPNRDDYIDESTANVNICGGGCAIQNDYPAQNMYCTGDLAGAILVICPHGNWELIENGPDIKPTYFMANNGTRVFDHCDQVDNGQLWCCYN